MMNNVAITPDAIKKIGYHNYATTNHPESKKFNWEMQRNIKRVLYASMAKAGSREVVLIMHVPTLKIDMNTDYDIANVSLNSNMHNALLNYKGPFISVHNHPNNSFFSVKDLITFLSYASMQSCFVVGNSGNVIHVMVKDVQKSNYKLHILIERIIRKLTNISIIQAHSSARPYLELLTGLGINYKTYYER